MLFDIALIAPILGFDLNSIQSFHDNQLSSASLPFPSLPFPFPSSYFPFLSFVLSFLHPFPSSPPFYYTQPRSPLSALPSLLPPYPTTLTSERTTTASIYLPTDLPTYLCLSLAPLLPCSSSSPRLLPPSSALLPLASPLMIALGKRVWGGVRWGGGGIVKGEGKERI